MEHRHLDATNPSEKWFGKQGREKLPRLRTMHGYSPLNTTAEWFTRIPNIPQSDTKDPSETEESEARSFRSGQKHEITDRFIHHSQSAKKVYWLTTFLDDYQRYQENLKKPNDLPIEQLQAMRSDIQIFLVAESLISDQQLPEAAKKNIKAFLDPHLEEINAGIDRMKTLKSVKYFPFSDVALAYMDKLQENLAKFAEKLGQAGITNLDQLKENLKDLLKEIRRREIEHKKKIYDIITTISSKLDEVKKDRYFAFNANVLECERNLKAARSYKDQARGVTTEGLRKQCQILRDDNESLDKLIETRIKEKVDQWSEQVGDVPCIQPGPGMFRNFEIASVLDTPAFVRLADNFHVALQPRKQPEDIYRALHSLQRKPVAIDRLKSVYKNKYKKTLETALEERFGDSPQQNYALQLINQGNAETEQSIKPLSEYPSEDELYQVANRIYRALTRRYPSEVVYAALTPFERNTELLCSLEKCYYKNYLEADLKSDILQGDPKAKDYALFLLGMVQTKRFLLDS